MTTHLEPKPGASHQLINQTSGDVEYYTPLPIVDAARACMGNIHLDPASSHEANVRVRAFHYYTEKADGLRQSWHYDTIWLNHPFSRDGNPLWINKVESEFRAGAFEQACCITFAATSEKWFQPLLARPQCFLVPRTNYFLPDGTLKRGVTKGSVVTYYGLNTERFAECFAHLGVCKWRITPNK